MTKKKEVTHKRKCRKGHFVLFFRCKTKEPPTCDVASSKRFLSNDNCGLLVDKKGAFAKCIVQFPEMAKDFLDSCVFDMCALKKDPKQFKLSRCASLEAFAEECEEKGVIMKWRSSKLCRE